MATYGDKYYASFFYTNGSSVTLTVKQKGWTGGTYEIAHIQGLSLEVGGGSEPVYAPVVKTTLHFSMADAFDIGTEVGGVECVTLENGRYIKHGRWEEFYTNDATKYLVILSWAGLPTRSGAIWQGYITPDSWEESMIYRGTINITARDMLGVLSDVDFDAEGLEGLISVGDLIRAALVKCEAPMALSFGPALRNIAEDFSIFAAQIDVRAFKGKTWWNALTETLEALGLVLRYNGNGGWVAASLRYLPNIITQETHGCEFINRSGLRVLEPPVKEIAGEFGLDIESSPISPLDVDDLVNFGSIFILSKTGLEGPITDRYQGGNTDSFELQMRSGDWDAGIGSSSRPPLFFKPLSPYPNIAISDDPYFVCNTGQLYYVLGVLVGPQRNYGVAKVVSGVFTAPCRLIIEQSGDIVARENNSFIPPRPATGSAPFLEEVRVFIKANGQYYAGGGIWVTGTEKTSDRDATSGSIDPISLPFDGGAASIDIFPPANSDGIDLEVNIVYIGTSAYSNYSLGPSLYVPLRVSIGENSGSGLANEYSVKTVRNEAYNVRIDRSLAIGSIDTVLPGKIIKNALKKSGSGRVLANSWNWEGQSTGYPLEVMVQAQLLQFFAASLSLFTGSFHDTTTNMAAPGSAYQYFQRSCILLRGTFDFTTGFVNDAALREFMTWEQVWANFNPQYTIVEERTGEGSGSSGGGHSGGGGGGGGGTTVTWGTETADHYAPLSVGGDERDVALAGHKHVIADVTDLVALIPSQASANNQLADKEFVNSSIATSTADFRGTSAQHLTESEFIAWANGLTHNQNDYVYWWTTDGDGNTVYKRYKWDGTTWVYEYDLNNSSFTAEQWAAINSGITNALKNKLVALPTAEDLNDTLDHLEDDKQDLLTFDDVPTSGSNNPVKSGGIFNRFTEIVNMIAQKATAAWGAVTNYVAKLTINGTEKEVLLKGWNPGFAGNTGLPTYAHPGGTESYKYTKGASGAEQTITEEFNQGQPRKIDHIGTHPELTAPVAIPGFINDLAYFRQRGGGCKLYVNNVERTDERYAYYKDAMFNCGPGSMSFDGTHTYTPEGGSSTTYHLALTSPNDTARISLDFTTLLDAAVQLDSTFFTTKFAYGSYLYIDFGNDWWGPRECTAIVKYGRYKRDAQGGVYDITEDTANRQTFKYTGPGDEGHLDFLRLMINSNTSYGIIGIDIVFTGFHEDTYEATVYKYKPRVSEIGVVGLSSRGPAEGLMARGADDPVYRSITPANDATYDLGAAAKRWRYAYVKRVYLSATAYLEIGQDSKAHLYGATGLVVENGDIASAG